MSDNVDTLKATYGTITYSFCSYPKCDDCYWKDKDCHINNPTHEKWRIK